METGGKIPNTSRTFPSWKSKWRSWISHGQKTKGNFILMFVFLLLKEDCGSYCWWFRVLASCVVSFKSMFDKIRHLKFSWTKSPHIQMKAWFFWLSNPPKHWCIQRLLCWHTFFCARQASITALSAMRPLIVQRVVLCGAMKDKWARFFQTSKLHQICVRIFPKKMTCVTQPTLKLSLCSFSCYQFLYSQFSKNYFIQRDESHTLKARSNDLFPRILYGILR